MPWPVSNVRRFAALLLLLLAAACAGDDPSAPRAPGSGSDTNEPPDTTYDYARQPGRQP